MFLKRWLLLCCVLALPCAGIANLLIYLATAKPQRSVASIESGVTVFDFGTVRVGDVVEYVFSLWNIGGVTLAVEDVELSCECLSVIGKPVRVAPGEKFDLGLRLVPDTEGDFEYTATVRFSDSSIEPRRFALTGRVAPAVVRSDYITAVSLRRLMAREDRLSVVDLRGHSEFSRTHIANAMSIPAGVLHHKSWLKSRAIVLVDDGTGWGTTERLCHELREAGFGSVSILEGGMAGWHAVGGAVDGRPTSKSSQVASMSRGGAARTRGAVVTPAASTRVVRTRSTRKKGCGRCP